MPRTLVFRLLLQVTGLLASRILVQQPPRIQVLQGSPASLTCLFNHSLDNEKLLYHKWFRGDGAGQTAEVHKNFTRTLLPNSNSSQFSISAHFPSVQLDQADTYVCEVVILWHLQRDFGRGPGTLLDVHAPPSVSITPTEQEVELKEHKLKLTCTVSGYYPKGINITWLYPDNRTVTKGVTWTSEQDEPHQGFRMTSYLMLHFRTANQQVKYSCQVDHSTLRSPITRHFNFTLKYGSINQQVSLRSSPLGRFSPLSGQHVSAPVGSFLELRCVVTSFPPSRVVWMDPSGTVRAESLLSNATMTLSPLQTPDSGAYTCVAPSISRRTVQEVQIEVFSPVSMSARWVTFPVFMLAVTSIHVWSRCHPRAHRSRPDGGDASSAAAPP